MGNTIPITPTTASKELAVGHFVTLHDYKSTTVTDKHRFQNFHIGEIVEYTPTGSTTKERYLFLPFGFSGVTISTDGSGTDADLIFPSNDLARSWAADAVEGRWTAEVKTMLVDPADRTTFGTAPLGTFWGQVSSGGFDDTKLKLTLSSVIDAVGAAFPQRRLTPSLVGSLPTTSNVRMQ